MIFLYFCDIIGPSKGRDGKMEKIKYKKKIEEIEKRSFHDDLAAETKRVFDENHNVVYAIVGITPHQQAIYKNRMAKTNRMRFKSSNNDGEMGYVSTIVQDTEVLYVIAPNAYVSTLMFCRAPASFDFYRNSSSFFKTALDYVQCVDSNGILRRVGEYALVEVCNLENIDEDNKKYLTKDLPERLNLIARVSDNTLTYFCVPPLQGIKKSDSKNNFVLSYCREKTERLAIALSNCQSANKLNPRGKLEGALPCVKTYGKFSNEQLLEAALAMQAK